MPRWVRPVAPVSPACVPVAPVSAPVLVVPARLIAVRGWRRRPERRRAGPAWPRPAAPLAGRFGAEFR